MEEYPLRRRDGLSLRLLHRSLFFTFAYPISKLKQDCGMLFYPLLLTQRSNISGQNSREAAKCGNQLFRKRLDISLWNRIGQQEFKQRLVSICSLISSNKVSLEPFPMPSFTFNV